MRKNIRQIKRELRNFAKSARRPVRARHFARRWEDDGEEGETLQDKCEIINRNLFGRDGEEYFLNPEELVEFFKKANDCWTCYASRKSYEACEHLIAVLTYLIGKDRKAKRPKSLAVYEPSEIVAGAVAPLVIIGVEEPFDYAELGEEEAREFLEEEFDNADEEFKEAVLDGSILDEDSDAAEELREGLLEWVSLNEFSAWDRLLGNDKYIQEAIDEWEYVAWRKGEDFPLDWANDKEDEKEIPPDASSMSYQPQVIDGDICKMRAYDAIFDGGLLEEFCDKYKKIWSKPKSKKSKNFSRGSMLNRRRWRWR